MIDAYAPIISLKVENEALWSKISDGSLRSEPFGLTNACFYKIESGIEISLNNSILGGSISQQFQ
jgi:hypothetical protein